MYSKKELSRKKKNRLAELQTELNMCYSTPSAYARRGEKYVKALKAEIKKLYEE